MTDIATLGLAVDSRQVTQATTALGGLTAAAGKSETAANNLTKSHAGLSTQAMAAQHSIRSMIEQMAMGMPPTTILASQINHLSYAASGPGGLSGAFGEVGTMLRSLISPQVAVVAGLGAVAGLAVAATVSWKNYALALDDLSKRAGITATEMSKLQSAAGFKGIDTTDFTKGAEKFSEDIYLAKNNIGSLATLLRANGVPAVQDFSDGMNKVADLVQRARGDTEKQIAILQSAGLPATMTWVRLMEDGAAGLAKAKQAAIDFGGAANDSMVAKARAFDDAWNKTWTNFGVGWRGAIVTAIDDYQKFDKAFAGGKLWQWLSSGAVLGGDLQQKYALQTSKGSFAPGVTLPGQKSNYALTGATMGLPSTGGDKPSVDPQTEIAALTRYNAMVSALGNLATTQQTVKARENELRIAYLQSGVSVGSYADAVKRQTQFQSEATKINAAASYGIFDYARAAANASLELQTLKDAKIVQSFDDQAAAVQVITKRLKDLSDNAAVARSALEQTTRYGLDASNMNKNLDSLFTSTFGNMENGFASVVSGAKDFKTAFSDMTQSILSDLAKMVIRQNVTGPLASLIGGSNLGGTLGSSGSAVVPSASFIDHGFGFDTGGYTGPGGKYEPAGIVHRGEYVMDSDTVSRLGVSTLNRLRGYASGGYVDSVPNLPQMAPIARGTGAMGSGPITVNVMNAPAGTTPDVQTQRQPNGGVRIDVQLKQMVENTVASSVRSGEGPIHSALFDKYGMRPKL